MIEVTNVSKSFGDVQALKDINFSVNEGQVVGFLGANGAGKTTTMDIICGCIGADQGQVKISGIDILAEPVAAKQMIGYLPDEPPVHYDMYVEDFIRYAANLNLVPVNQLSDRVDDTIRRLDLDAVRRRVVGNLSKGYKQRVALAQAIVHDPRVLVLDEPTEGLDPNQIIEIRNLIHELKEKHTIILSSHILSEVENTCDEIIVIHEGRILQQGSRASLEAALSKRKGFQYLMKISPDVERAIEILKGITGIEAVRGVAEQFIEFKLSEDEAVIEQVVRQFTAANIGISEIRPEQSTLEDVFFSLTRGVH